MIDLDALQKTDSWIGILRKFDVLHEMIEELKALRELEKAARPLIRCLELIQMVGETELGAFSKELKLQQALEKLDEARRG